MDTTRPDPLTVTLAQGTQLAGYEILALLGTGGMGEVYHARDRRLGREVAVKVLKRQFADNPEQLSRFEREAQALAALNHPNIAAIYGIEEVTSPPNPPLRSGDGGTVAFPPLRSGEGAAGSSPPLRFGEGGGGERLRFLVMEFVPGETLADSWSRRRPGAEEVLAVARQVAEAVEAAHEKGIIHRDLKPANVKITPEGKVKVLDFGLAKTVRLDAVASPDESTKTYENTRQGVLMGTPAYMSPEQARGKPLDKRTDVWSFGCLLYEGLAGRRAFAGETFADMLAAIVEREPDWQALPADLPERIRHLVRRCLHKEPQRRLRDLGDARIEIDEALSTPAVDERPVRAQAGKAVLRQVLRWGLVLLAVAIVFAAGIIWQKQHHPPGVAWTGDLLLGGSTRAFMPRVSPDGEWLAFLVLVDGQSQVAVMRLNTGEWRVLTTNRSIGLVDNLCWSRDGTRIYFDRWFDSPQGVYRVPVVSGEERQVLDGAENPHALPDGSLIVGRINADRNYQIHRLRPDSDELKPIGPPIYHPTHANWPVRAFPDGKEAVFYGKPLTEGAADVAGVYVLDLETGKVRQLAPELEFDPEDQTLAIDASGEKVLTAVPEHDLYRIVAIPRSGNGPVTTLLRVTEGVSGLDVGPDGSIYLDQHDRPQEFLRFRPEKSIPERLATAFRTRAMSPLLLPGSEGRLLLPSTSSGRDRLLTAMPGKDARPFADTGMQTGPPAVRVGDDKVAFLAGEGPQRRIALASLPEGRILKRLEQAPGQNIDTLAASPDGKILYYVQVGQVYAVPTADGPPQKIHPGDSVAVDPNNSELIVQMTGKDGVKLYRLQAAGGKGEEIPVRSALRLAPSPLAPDAVGQDGRILVAVTTRDSWFYSVAILDPKTGNLEPIALDYHGDLRQPAWGPDGLILATGLPFKTDVWRFRAAGP